MTKADLSSIDISHSTCPSETRAPLSTGLDTTVPEISVLILAVCLLTVLPRKMRRFFLGSERSSSTTTAGTGEPDIAPIASNRLDAGASGSENSPDTSHRETSAAKIEATFKLLLIILEMFGFYRRQ